MNQPTVIMISSVGTASAVSVINALRTQTEIPIRLVGVDMRSGVPAAHMVDEFAVVPSNDSPGFLETVLGLCDFHSVEVLLPTHSSEIEFFSRHLDAFEKAGVHMLLPQPQVAAQCNNKREMNSVVQALGIRTPQIRRPISEEDFPVFARPNRGSGSNGARILHSMAELELVSDAVVNFEFFELISGPEYTVDLLARQDSSLVAISPRERQEVRDGQTVRGVTRESVELSDLVTEICKEIRFVGPGNMQFMIDESGPVFIELNPRFAAGGLGLTVEAGANIPLMTVKLALGHTVEDAQVQPGVSLLRYYKDLILKPGGKS